MERARIADALFSAGNGSLFAQADAVRKKFWGDGVYLRGIIELSSVCEKNCLYCGLRKSNRKAVRYRMSEEEIFISAKRVIDAGIKTVVLQSGQDSGSSIKTLCRVVERIKSRLDCAITLSAGEKSPGEYLSLKNAGADRYLLKFETSDERLFKKLKPDSSFGGRLGCLEALKKAGFQTGSGNIVGLPGQTADIIAGDIVLMKHLELDMASVSPFIPHPDTPLGGHKAGDFILSLKTLALTRIEVPSALIPATTAMSAVDAKGRERALACGANVVMPNFTPAQYRNHYYIYPGRQFPGDDAEKGVSLICKMVESAGRKISPGYGHGLKRRGL